MKQSKKGPSTRDCILQKAEELFAQKGYDVVSIREITAAAKCNISSVNYHFGSKKKLYMEVFRSRWIPRELKILEHLKESLIGKEDLSPGDVIQTLARAYLEGPLSEDDFRCHRQLIIREINNPTKAFEVAANQTLRPLYQCLQDYLKPFLPDDQVDETLTLDILCVFGMLLYFNYSRPMISSITGREYDTAFKTKLINHIVRFSLEGLDLNGKKIRTERSADN